MAIRVLFLCTGNSARSQMAEGLLRRLGGKRFEVFSAGTRPRERVHTMAIETMAKEGIDISKQRPKDVSQFRAQRFDFVVTLCEEAVEQCDVIAGAEVIRWSFRDPAEIDEDDAAAKAFRETLVGLRRRIELFITANTEKREEPS